MSDRRINLRIFSCRLHILFSYRVLVVVFSYRTCYTLQDSCLLMVYSLVVRARGLKYWSRKFKSRSLHLKPETNLREERGLSGCRNRLILIIVGQADKSTYFQLQTTYSVFIQVLRPPYLEILHHKGETKPVGQLGEPSC